jgi:ornithine lipid ester-linked acyl 2-hydroxylase
LADSKNIWYNYWRSSVPDISENFYNPNDYIWAKDVLLRKDQIARELEGFIEEKQGKLNSHFYGNELESKQDWQTQSFKTWDIEVPINLNECSEIKSFLAANPMVISASVNILKANSKIKVHRGDTNAIFRCHLGLVIPSEIPECGFSVGDEHRSWKTGELLIFNDASEHYAWNNTDKDRIIFLFDVIIDDYLNDKKFISINVRSFLLLQYLSTKFSIVKKMPKFVHRFIHFCIKVFLHIIYSYQKKKGVILEH